MAAQGGSAMTKRLPVAPSPGPLEGYAAHFDGLLRARAQREGFRRYLEGLLLPAERNNTLTALANTEPVVGAQRKEAQSLQWFRTCFRTLTSRRSLLNSWRSSVMSPSCASGATDASGCAQRRPGPGSPF